MIDVPHRGIEFVCTDCGQSICAYGYVNEFKLCAQCLFMPGWHNDPRLCAILRWTPQAAADSDGGSS